MISKLLTWAYYLLFALTPLIWTSKNFELFEYSKMMFVYGLTVVICALWLLRMLKEKKIIFKRSPLDLPLFLFLIANIASTIFSVEPHTSIWGYYTRSNGGLLSTTSYLLLYWALLANFTTEYAEKFLKAAVFGGVVVALYAIPEHFGVSPSCVILTGQANASCWVQDVQARVFATLGQPNWLAAYLAMLIFPTLYFALISTKKSLAIFYLFLTTILYLAFTFTYSRGGTLGLIAGAAIFTAGYLYTLRFKITLTVLKIPGTALIIFILVNLLFGSALTDFTLLSKFAPPPRPAISLSSPTETQLENGGTESGEIRLIVWQGAIDIFKHYPFFGSGVETFAYTYYQFRPMAHNMVSEWDFLYNKAHNEYLNYLATTGLVGFLSYMTIIFVFVVWAIKFSIFNFQFSNNAQNFEISNGRKKKKLPVIKERLADLSLLNVSVLAAYISYLVQNFFGFSVVIIAVFFYLFPALIFLSADSAQPFTIRHSLFAFIYRRGLYYKTAVTVIIVITVVLLYKLLSFWQADTYFALGNSASDAGKPGLSYNEIYEAMQLNPWEPYYQSELTYAAASSAVALQDQDTTLSGELKDQADLMTTQLLKDHPKNVSFFRTAIRTDYMLSTLDKNYTQKTLNVIDATIVLAPTDPKLPYNKALILEQMGQNQEAAAILEKVIQMKPNYKEAYLALADAYSSLNQKGKAKDALDRLLKVIPGDPQALDQLNKINKK